MVFQSSILRTALCVRSEGNVKRAGKRLIDAFEAANEKTDPVRQVRDSSELSSCRRRSKEPQGSMTKLGAYALVRA
jgi:hypothetical protein